MAGIGLGRLLGREHASTPNNGVDAPRAESAASRKKNGVSPNGIIFVVCRMSVVEWRVVVRAKLVVSGSSPGKKPATVTVMQFVIIA